MTAWTPASPLAHIVDLAGFSYDPDQQIIYSKLDALQRHLGYAYAYDATAMAISANIDCEPIFFEHAGKTWMIELWKGQYGVETGCEIGVYNRGPNAPAYDAVLDLVLGRRDGDPDPAHSLFFNCVGDDEMLEMSFTIERDGIPLFTRGPERHWWLTGFKWGVYSEPEQLTVSYAVDMPDDDMRGAFVDALKNTGYTPDVDDTTVKFVFATPFSYQPRLNSPLLPAVEQANAAIVDVYQGLDLPSNDPNIILGAAADRIAAAIGSRSPDFFGTIAATAFKDAGRSADEFARMLAADVGIAASTVAAWVTDAGYDLRTWVEAVYAAVAEVFTMNFSCAVEIDNRARGTSLPHLLTRVDFGIKDRFLGTCGHYMVQPPTTIQPGSIGRFYVKDYWGAEGAEGWATYSYFDEGGQTRSVKFTFGCPTGDTDNYASSNDPKFATYARSGDDNTWHPSVPTRHHPLNVAYVWGGGPSPS